LLNQTRSPFTSDAKLVAARFPMCGVVAFHILLACMFANARSTSTPPRWGSLVINLNRRPDRLKRFVEALQISEPWLLERGRICRIEGRDGKELPDTQDSRRHSLHQRRASKSVIGHGLVPRSLQDATSLVNSGWATENAVTSAQSGADHWPRMTKGGLGLYLGHADAWQHVVEAGWDRGLIFEDDLTLFSSNFKKYASQVLNSSTSTPSWDLMYLQRCNDDLWPKERTYTHKAKIPSTGSMEVRIGEHERITCTGAYIITKKGAIKLLSGALPADDQLDDQLGNVPDLVRVALSPPVAQCEEVFKNKDGERIRDTDVQTYKKLDVHDARKDMDALADKFLHGLMERRKKLLAARRSAFMEKVTIPNCRA